MQVWRNALAAGGCFVAADQAGHVVEQGVAEKRRSTGHVQVEPNLSRADGSCLERDVKTLS